MKQSLYEYIKEQLGDGKSLASQILNAVKEGASNLSDYSTHSIHVVVFSIWVVIDHDPRAHFEARLKDAKYLLKRSKLVSLNVSLINELLHNGNVSADVAGSLSTRLSKFPLCVGKCSLSPEKKKALIVSRIKQIRGIISTPQKRSAAALGASDQAAAIKKVRIERAALISVDAQMDELDGDYPDAFPSDVVQPILDRVMKASLLKQLKKERFIAGSLYQKIVKYVIKRIAPLTASDEELHLQTSLLWIMVDHYNIAYSLITRLNDAADILNNGDTPSGGAVKALLHDPAVPIGVISYLSSALSQRPPWRNPFVSRADVECESIRSRVARVMCCIKAFRSGLPLKPFPVFIAPGKGSPAVAASCAKEKNPVVPSPHAVFLAACNSMLPLMHQYRKGLPEELKAGVKSTQLLLSALSGLERSADKQQSAAQLLAVSFRPDGYLSHIHKTLVLLSDAYPNGIPKSGDEGVIMKQMQTVLSRLMRPRIQIPEDLGDQATASPGPS